MVKRISGKTLGLKKGDFVHTGAFPGIVIGNANSYAPVLEVWGLAHEIGSAYAHELIKISRDEFVALASKYGYDGTAYSKTAKKALE